MNTRLSVNVNKIATLRNARGGNNPDIIGLVNISSLDHPQISYFSISLNGIDINELIDLSTKKNQMQIVLPFALSFGNDYKNDYLKIKNVDTGSILEYTLVSDTEADLATKKISANSPIGKALLAKKKLDVVKVEVPSGLMTFEVLDISR